MKKLNVKNQMKFNKWTVALGDRGGQPRIGRPRRRKMNAVQTALSNTTLSGYVDTAATWRPGTDQDRRWSQTFPIRFCEK